MHCFSFFEIFSFSIKIIVEFEILNHLMSPTNWNLSWRTFSFSSAYWPTTWAFCINFSSSITSRTAFAIAQDTGFPANCKTKSTLALRKNQYLFVVSTNDFEASLLCDYVCTNVSTSISFKRLTMGLTYLSAFAIGLQRWRSLTLRMNGILNNRLGSYLTVTFTVYSKLH